MDSQRAAIGQRRVQQIEQLNSELVEERRKIADLEAQLVGRVEPRELNAAGEQLEALEVQVFNELSALQPQTDERRFDAHATVTDAEGTIEAVLNKSMQALILLSQHMRVSRLQRQNATGSDSAPLPDETTSLDAVQQVAAGLLTRTMDAVDEIRVETQEEATASSTLSLRTRRHCRAS